MVVYKAGQGIELGLTHLDVVALSEVFHRISIATIIDHIHQLSISFLLSQVVVEGFILLHHVTIAHGGIARGNVVIPDLGDQALKVGQHRNAISAGNPGIIGGRGGADIARSHPHGELIVVRGPSTRRHSVGIRTNGVITGSAELHSPTENLHRVGGQSMSGSLAGSFRLCGNIGALCRTVHNDKSHLCPAGIRNANKVKIGVYGYDITVSIGKTHGLCRSDRDLAGCLRSCTVGKGDRSSAGLHAVKHGTLAVAAIAHRIAGGNHTGITALPTHGPNIGGDRTVQTDTFILRNGQLCTAEGGTCGRPSTTSRGVVHHILTADITSEAALGLDAQPSVTLHRGDSNHRSSGKGSNGGITSSGATAQTQTGFRCDTYLLAHIETISRIGIGIRVRLRLSESLVCKRHILLADITGGSCFRLHPNPAIGH